MITICIILILLVVLAILVMFIFLIGIIKDIRNTVDIGTDVVSRYTSKLTDEVFEVIVTNRELKEEFKTSVEALRKQIMAKSSSRSSVKRKPLYMAENKEKSQVKQTSEEQK